MIKSFQVPNSTPQQFIEKISSALSGRDLGKIATMNLAGDNVLVTFSKLGKSEVTFAVKKEGDSFRCDHQAEKIALTHRALRNDIEGKLARVLEAAGATVVQG